METLSLLEANRARFIRFLSTRVGDAAEDVLQSALMRAVESSPQASGDDAVIGWFMAVLQNAVIDHHRRARGATRALGAHAAEAPHLEELELRGAVCSCIAGAAKSLKPEYAEVLEAVELEQQLLGDVASRLGITANNARVRLHRARAALRDELVNTCKACAAHGCLDCSCHGSRPKLSKTQV